MSFNFSGTTEKISSNKATSTGIVNDPAYREKCKEKFDEVQRKNMDIVQFPNGNIVVIEEKPTFYVYSWDPKKMDFERVKKNKEE